MLPAFACVLLGARQIRDAHRRRKFPELLPVAIVQQRHAHLAGGIVHCERAKHRCAHDRERLVVRRYEDVDRRPRQGISRVAPLAGAPADEGSESTRG